MARFKRVISVNVKGGPREAGHDGSLGECRDQALSVSTFVGFELAPNL